MAAVNTPSHSIAVRPVYDGGLLVCLAGQFDMSVGTALVDALRLAAQEPSVVRVTVDLERVTFFDSHGIAGLVAGYEAARTAGRAFSVSNARGMVKQVLDITGLSEVLCEDDGGVVPA